MNHLFLLYTHSKDLELCSEKHIFSVGEGFKMFFFVIVVQ